MRISQLCLISSFAGHEGNSYLVMFPQFRFGNTTVAQIMITAHQDITVSLKSPFPGVSRIVNVSATDGAAINLPSGIMQRGNDIELKGVLVESDSEFSLFGYNQRGSVKGEAYTAIPTKYLGTSYFVVGYKNAFLSIVALNDDTRVNITLDSGDLSLPYNGKIYKTGNTLTVYLSRLSTFQLKGNDDTLMGADIKSDKTIAVVSGSTCDSISSEKTSYCNHLMSYVPPSDRLGNTFIVPHIPQAKCSYIFAYSKYEHTNVTISISGQSENTTGTFRGYNSYLRASNIPYIVKTNNPSIVLQYTTLRNASTFPTQILIPAVTQYSNHYKFITPSNQSYDNHAAIIIRSDDVSGLHFDGGKIYKMDSDIKTVIDSDALYNVISLNISVGIHVVYHVDPDIVFGLVLYGSDTDQSYGMPSGLDLGRKRNTSDYLFDYYKLFYLMLISRNLISQLTRRPC